MVSAARKRLKHQYRGGREQALGILTAIRVIFRCLAIGQEVIGMKVQASFIKDGKWWVAWTDDVPGALTQGATLEEARENLVDAVRMVRKPLDLSKLPKNKVLTEQLEV